MPYPSITLKGRDVELHPLTLDVADALSEAASESRENYLFTPVPNGIEEARAYVARALVQYERGERIPFTILFQGKVVGTTSFATLETWIWPPANSLQRKGRPDVVEIGYTWLAQSAQRTSCNSEAKFLLLEYAFDEWGVHRVSFRTDERNDRSRRAIERLGAKFEGIRRADMPSVDGSVRNSAYYSILRSEWAGVKSWFVERLGSSGESGAWEI